MSKTYQISEVALKLEIDDLKAEGERFRSFDENFLPLELEQLQESNTYILQKLASKCNKAVQFHKLSEKLREQITTELDIIANFEKEITEFKEALATELTIAKSAITRVDCFASDFISIIKGHVEGPRDIVLALMAYLCLGPEGTMGSSDLTWKTSVGILEDKEKLKQQMSKLLEGRIKDISRAEIEAANEFMSHLAKECPLHVSGKCQPIAKVIGIFVNACLCYWDLWQAIEARTQMQDLKRDKLKCIQQEMNTYREISSMLEKEVDEIYEKYRRSKIDFESIRKVAVNADEAMHKYEEHMRDIEVEQGKDKKNVTKISSILDEIRKDKDDFETIRVRMNYKLPGDTVVP